VPAQLVGTNLSLFGAGHWRKNILVQTAAFDRARRDSEATDWTLHLNGQTLGGNSYAEWLKSARIPYVEHGWCDRSTYLSLVAGMDVGLCATLSESYCYVSADHVSLGVPVVASPAIACLGDVEARVAPDDIGAVARALLLTLADRDGMARRQRQGLNEQARLNAERARAALHEIMTRAGFSRTLD
jgi:glycosyltransferase involved in cell wall biosynthesis